MWNEGVGAMWREFYRMGGGGSSDVEGGRRGRKGSVGLTWRGRGGMEGGSRSDVKGWRRGMGGGGRSDVEGREGVWKEGVGMMLSDTVGEM